MARANLRRNDRLGPAAASSRERRTGMERWFIVGSVIAIFLVLAVAGWHFRQATQSSTAMCASPEAHCGERGL